LPKTSSIPMTTSSVRIGSPVFPAARLPAMPGLKMVTPSKPASRRKSSAMAKDGGSQAPSSIRPVRCLLTGSTLGRKLRMVSQSAPLSAAMRPPRTSTDQPTCVAPSLQIRAGRSRKAVMAHFRMDAPMLINPRGVGGKKNATHTLMDAAGRSFARWLRDAEPHARHTTRAQAAYLRLVQAEAGRRRHHATILPRRRERLSAGHRGRKIQRLRQDRQGIDGLRVALEVFPRDRGHQADRGQMGRRYRLAPGRRHGHRAPPGSIARAPDAGRLAQNAHAGRQASGCSFSTRSVETSRMPST